MSRTLDSMLNRELNRSRSTKGEGYESYATSYESSAVVLLKVRDFDLLPREKDRVIVS